MARQLDLLGGSLMPPEVIEAMNAAAQQYVPIRDLNKAVGDKIAQLTGNAAGQLDGFSF